MRWIRTFCLSLAILAMAASIPFALEERSIWVQPGVAELEYLGFEVRVEASDDVIVHLSLVDGEVVGRVDAAPGTRGANVLITIVDDPERIIFQGRVVAETWFADYFPNETGRGEQ
jgi:hypothetical protein